MAVVKKAVVRGFNDTSYTATVEVVGSGKAYLEEVTVARSVPSAEMVTGRSVAVLFFDEQNVKDAVVLAVYV